MQTVFASAIGIIGLLLIVYPAVGAYLILTRWLRYHAALWYVRLTDAEKVERRRKLGIG